jgi:hypothetical protein
MADDRKSKNEGGARRVAEWLVSHQTDFEQGNVVETQLAAAVGLPEKELTAAVDYLENREEVVRFPRAVLKPGRGWPELRAQIAGRGAAASAATRSADPGLRA